MNKLQMTKLYFENYVIENDINVNGTIFENLLDILYDETVEYFDNYQSFYEFFTADF